MPYLDNEFPKVAKTKQDPWKKELKFHFAGWAVAKFGSFLFVDEHYQFIHKTMVKAKNKPWLELI